MLYVLFGLTMARPHVATFSVMRAFACTMYAVTFVSTKLDLKRGRVSDDGCIVGPPNPSDLLSECFNIGDVCNFQNGLFSCTPNQPLFEVRMNFVQNLPLFTHTK